MRHGSPSKLKQAFLPILKAPIILHTSYATCYNDGNDPLRCKYNTTQWNTLCEITQMKQQCTQPADNIQKRLFYFVRNEKITI